MPLITLRNLLELRISQNRIQDPRPIADLPKLLDLRLQDNRMDLNNSTVQQAMIQLSDKGTFVQTDPQDRVIEIADNKLAEALRNSMGKPVDEEFTLSELKALDTIEAEGLGITSLDGLEHASNLRTLRLKKQSHLRYRTNTTASPPSTIRSLAQPAIRHFSAKKSYKPERASSRRHFSKQHR